MIVMIYQKDTFREFVLPKTNNLDYTIVLDKKQFHISENVTLLLEYIDGTWTIFDSEQYTIVHNNASKSQVELKDLDILFFTTCKGERFQGIIAKEEMAFAPFEKYDISNVNTVTFGNDNGTDITYQFQELISKNHGAIIRNGNEYYVDDYSTNGVFINYTRINGRTKLSFGDVINVFGLQLVFLGSLLGISTKYGVLQVHSSRIRKVNLALLNDERNTDNIRRERPQLFNRSPRNNPDIHRGTVEIESPPSPKVTHKKPLLLTIGPSFTMTIPMMLGCLLSIYGSRASGGKAGPFMFTGIITAVGSAVIGVMWALVNMKYSKQQEKEDEQLRFDGYGNYLIEIAEELRKDYQNNTDAMHIMYPSAADCSTYGRENVNLWNRNITHEDFFFCRLGLGDIPFQKEIKVQKEKFTLVADVLKKQPQTLVNEYQTLHSVPVGITITDHKLWGIVGGANLVGAYQIMYNLVAQIAANICYTDIKMAFVYNQERYGDRDAWAFAKWLPHAWSEDKKTRFVASNELEAKDVFFELSNIMRHRGEDEGFGKKTFRPHYVLFLAEPEYIEGELLRKYIYDEEDYGITTFILAESFDKLPNDCENIVQNDSFVQGVYNTMDTSGNRQGIQYDTIDFTSLKNMAIRLSNIQVNETESDTNIPNSLEFLEMYGVKSLEELNVLDRWKKNRTFNTMKALVGKKAGGGDCYLDVHEKYHGPHGLIAGTTGSGKSETLQTYILSLAINYSPDDVGFFVIDFKGGGMANLFSNLPHMIGQISNLSGNQVHRAMISIKSENMRRQRLFSEYGVNNINLYTRLYKNNETKIPIPHLFIIIDEFAELKREEPDFMRELISVAQVGRSLGVHLILATQKPSGTVDDNIWSNSKFRLCLRVQDRQDSNDMLHKPDAAYITQAGRCYMQVGNDEIYELFQSGWSGATYDESEAGSMAEIATMITLTGKTAIVGSYAKIKKREEDRKAFYTTIVNYAMSAMLSNHIFNVDNLDDMKLNQWTEDVIAQIHADGIKYEDSNSAVMRMKDMLKLWPKDSMSAEEIADYIIQIADTLHIRLPEMQEVTQLDAVVEYLAKIAMDNGYVHNLQLWLPVLPRELYFDTLIDKKEGYFNGRGWDSREKEWSLVVPIGLYDDPENQAQNPVYMNISESGHVAVCGTIVCGKSTFLQTILYGLVMKYTPQYVNIYGLDFSSGMLRSFEKMPHVGDILGENDLDMIAKLFGMLDKFVEERKKVFGGGNYAQYVKAYGVNYPAIMVVIDNYANFSEKTEGKFADTIIRLSREGVAYGIFLIMSAAGFGMNEIPSKVGDNIKNIVSLEMGDKFKYMEVLHTTHIDVMPEADVKGRGLVNIEGSILEFQTALCLAAEDDYKRGQLLEQLAIDMLNAWPGKKAKPVPRIPDKPVLSEFESLDEVMEKNLSKECIPIGYRQEDASIFSIDLCHTFCYLVAGRAKTGKTVLLKNIFKETLYKNGTTVVIEKGTKDFERIANDNGVKYIDNDKAIFEYFHDISPVFASRNKKKNQLLAEGFSHEEVYEEMKQESPIFIIIPDLVSFMTAIYKPEQGVGSMSGFMETIIAKGELHNIFFLAAVNQDEIGSVGGYRAFNGFLDYKNGVHLGGNTAAQRIFRFQNIPFNESGKTLKKGLGWATVGEDNTEAEMIVIPMYSGGKQV